MPTDHNPLIYNTSRAVGGREILLFLAALPLIGFPAFWLLPDRGLLSLLGLFFGVGLAAVLVAVAPLGWAAAPALGFRAVGWRPVLFGTLGTAAVSIAVSQIGLEPQGVKQAMRIAQEPAAFLLSLALLAGLAPLVEELVFRGLLYGWLESRWGGGIAFVASSLAFAAAHVEPAHAFLVLPLGLLFGLLRWRTGSLWPSLVAHMANNGLAVVAAAYLQI
ncbi:MAG: type II CAAX endopeptidase family protein [Reyranella sp.]|uniref:CPBP family intramembrane glutamic endopeptidase n=1 Tax=Reyranella sp. TaxID=1929291 RepID=UPI00272FD04F|nr:type II CAAX endopeptidase family protein [Reyranella sp.]MDP1967285.1 type II CAAX endopeptidase family protein [Reyranella sp.]MDP2376222.1 type II CAAX endopeptidase family protein [Reyranella sp.]